MNEKEIRQAIIDHCRQLNDKGLNQGTSGNISVRFKDGMLISPSGQPYDRMTTDSVVFVDFDGTCEGRLKPSSEWRFHLDLLKQRPEFNAVVHAHATYATVLAIKHLDIPPLHYMIAAAGGSSIRCADYATYGTEALSHNVTEAMTDRKACLLANHGMIAAEMSLPKAMWLAVEVETLARQYVISLQIGGPDLLDEEEIARVVEKFKNYGYQADKPVGRG